MWGYTPSILRKQLSTWLPCLQNGPQFSEFSVAQIQILENQEVFFQVLPHFCASFGCLFLLGSYESAQIISTRHESQKLSRFQSDLHQKMALKEKSALENPDLRCKKMANPNSPTKMRATKQPKCPHS